jgi:hypothetical protein
MARLSLANNIKVPAPLNKLALGATLFNGGANLHKYLIKFG